MNELPDNFGALPDEWSSYEKAKIVILPVPYEETSIWVTWKTATDKGPAALIEASKNMELFDIELQKELRGRLIRAR